ncbi:hypothetical protein L3Y34_002825 [Caenorhabditis briggsae]|uniref:EGF-like domain-containing protein n=3 Tax=Caenorhabditis briggsae TaxID=6238 RepID=A0AAE9A8W5_CAEBR|nr:hypothetical protein L3Y34_002825 [Caenorhabditis briggsae]
MEHLQAMNRRLTLLIGVLSVVSGVLTDDCPSFFNKDAKGSCTIRECLNGGYPDDANKTCICPSGYLGIHCEAVKTSMPPDNHFKAGGTSFNIININLYTQYWGFKTYDNIKKGLSNHLDSYPNGYDNYNLLETTGKPYLDISDQEVFGSYSFQSILSLTSETFFKLDNWTDTGLYWCYEVPIFDQLIQMIQQKNLKNTVITILTQHPPSNDRHDEAREIAVSFGIRVNVLWIKDDTFNRCTNEKIAQFKTFVDITGGLFVQLQSELNDSSTVNLVSQVFLTHYKPQYVSIQSFSDCSTPQQVPVVTDPTVNGPYNFVFLGENAKPGIDGFRTCSLLQPLRSVDNKLAIFQSLNPVCSSITIQASNDSCTAIIFTNANATVGPLDLTIYVTYVEDQSIDASRYAIVEGVPFYPAFHIESSSEASTTLNSISASFDIDWRVTPQNRSPATFEWISNKTMQCDASQTYSLYLHITVGDTNVQRAVRVACVPAPIATTVSVVSTTAVPTSIPTTVFTSSSAASTITFTDSSSSTSSSVTPSTCPYTQNYATFLFAYAADFNPTTYGMVSRTIGNLVKKNFPNNQTLANKLIDLEQPQNIKYTNNIVNFTTNCDVDIPNATLTATDIKASDALDAIKSFLNDHHSGRLEGSVVFILLNRLPKDLSSADNDLSPEDYDKLTNLNIKVFPIISISSLAKGALAGRSGAVFNKIAAQTNGHYVIADDSIGPDTNSDYNKIVSNFMNTAYNQNLLFTRNMGVNRIGTNLGVVKIPKSATDSPNITVTITVSLSAVDAHQPQPPSKLVLGIKPNPNFTNTKGILIDFNTTLPNQFSNSNYYTTTIELEAGIERELFLQYVAGSDNNDLLIRMWAAGDAFREATYMNYNENAELHFTNNSTINEDFGAALQFQFSGACSHDKTATLLITDCNGVVSAKYDSDQVASTSSGFYQFIPFFCSSQPTPATCISGAESKYDAQFVSDSFSITQSFQCRPGGGPIDTCQRKDANGNNQCSGIAPFKRGPHANLYDCSNHGHLEYNDTTKLFRCKCDDENFSGQSCEIATCSTKNSDPLATDNNYHTYTVVVGLEQANGFLVLDDAQKLFGLSCLDSLSYVWKYQLLTVCADGKYDMLYSGSNLKNFKDMFFLASNDSKVARPCNTLAQDGVHDLTDIYKQSVKGIGRNVKGIIVYFSEASKMINVTLEDFITASQPYQQQFFVYAIDETEIFPLTGGDNIVKAAMSTGGFLIQSYIDSDSLDHIDAKFLPDLLGSSSSISWMSTEQNSDFVISTSSPDIQSYLITYGTGGDLSNQNSLNLTCTDSDDTATMCQIKGHTKVLGRVDKGPYYVAVYSLNDALVPKAQIISDLGKDSSDAVSTSSSDARTILAIMLNNTFNIVANNGDGGITRNAQRNGCTFGWTSYSVFSDKKYETGVNIAQITIEGPGSNTYTRFFPFGTSSSPACHNGGTSITSTGSCKCPSNYQGPDCSLVNCSGSSKPNAWSDVCICANIDDVVCANQYTSVF